MKVRNVVFSCYRAMLQNIYNIFNYVLYFLNLFATEEMGQKLLQTI
jgi:hypothetical protein